ncbi:hypothetical protein H0H92_000168 [Tricholoma furcatifolium]|nr:hypothetical protein H0H92_000168 [Tricholoma furcatifolium]
MAYPNVEKLALDVNDDEAVERVVKHIAEAEGKIDIVVNNAGYINAGPLIDQTMEDVKANFDTNTFSIIRMAKAVIPIMAQRRSGLIVNIGSIVGEMQVSVLDDVSTARGTRRNPVEHLGEWERAIPTA